MGGRRLGPHRLEPEIQVEHLPHLRLARLDQRPQQRLDLAAQGLHPRPVPCACGRLRVALEEGLHRCDDAAAGIARGGLDARHRAVHEPERAEPNEGLAVARRSEEGSTHGVSVAPVARGSADELHDVLR